jgi:hypothetical protein
MAAPSPRVCSLAAAGLAAASFVAAFGAAVLVSPDARAAEDWEGLVKQANDLRRVGDDEGAYRLFLRAYTSAANPVTAGQLGLCEFALSRWVESESRLLEALRTSSDPWVAKNRATLLEVLDKVRMHLARLDVSGSPPGAEVEVAGNPVGSLPLAGPVRVVAGQVHVRVWAPGYRPWQQEVNLATGDRRPLVAHLELELPNTPAAPPVLRDRAPGPPRGGSNRVGAVTGGPGGRFGVSLRLDLAVYPDMGQRLLPGLLYGVTDRLDLAAAALLGKLTSGFWAGARYALADGPVRPSLSLGLPVVWMNGFPQTGVQGGVGLVVPIGGHLELAGDLTVAGFPNVAAGLGKLWILPAVGVQARY